MENVFLYAYGNYHRVQGASFSYNLIPFRMIGSLVTRYSHYNFQVWVYNLFGNIAVFIPIGFLLSWLFQKSTDWKMFLVSLIIIVFLETMQLITKLGVFDVDDIILNLMGCYIGYLIYLFARKLSNKSV